MSADPRPRPKLGLDERRDRATTEGVQAPRDLLRTISNGVQRTFRDDRTVLSYGQWFELMLDDPARNLRSSSQYLRDVFDYFGTTERALPEGRVRRFALFDAPWADGDGRVAGQERVQNELYRLINNFVRDGRVSRLIMLHGPNGSAKSSIIQCIQQGMEQYSRTAEGALYRFAWIFPSEKIVKGRLGFEAESTKHAPDDSFAHLAAEQVDARLPCEMRDHPLFFVPPSERGTLIEQIRSSGALPEDFITSRYLMKGELSPRDRAIYEALLIAHDGDHREVLRHVQVERFYFSSQYGEGIATIEPQMHVDAEARQITADRSIQHLPRALQTVPLFELGGPLVSANRGLLEFSDLLKRPAEAYKYLLTTSEEATAALPQFKLNLDEVLIASSNHKYLEAFKEHPDWMSFKARMELVRVPYLRRLSDEVEIYERQIQPTTVSKDLAPHVVECVAMFSVLTRLRCPDPDLYQEPVRSIVGRMTPLEKLRLYDKGTAPDWVSNNDARELSNELARLRREHDGSMLYEGLLGASAREMRTTILNAAHHPEYRTLTPLPVFDELNQLVNDPSLYDYLTQEARNGYHDNARFIDVVKGWWTDVIDQEFRVSMGLVEEARYEELFTRYVRHVSSFLKNEKIYDKITGDYVDADQELMKQVEDVLLADGEDKDDFRRSIIGRIGAWGLENTGATPNYRSLFEQLISRLEEDYFSRQRAVIARNLRAVLDQSDGDASSDLAEEAARTARHTVETMKARFSYTPACTSECAAFLLRERYASE